METATETLLEVTNLTKSYTPPLKALDEVNFVLRAGEVHALVGENGAGKSTFMRIVAGLSKPDQGEMYLRGQPYAPPSRRDAESRGVRMVMQELNLIKSMTVAESIYLGDLPRKLGVIRYERLNQEAQKTLARVGLKDIDPRSPVGTLGVGQQQMIEIAAALARSSEVLILDEPTASLTTAEIEILFAHLKDLKRKGHGVIYISHRMEEIRRIADRVTILRDGKVVATRVVGDITTEEIVHLMVGRKITRALSSKSQVNSKLALRVKNLSCGTAVKDVSFDLYHGEILGFAGLMGAGRTETMRAIFGADSPQNGQIYLHGAASPVEIKSPREAVRRGLALLTENRKEQGLLLPLSVTVNITLARLKCLTNFFGRIERDKEHEVAERFRHDLSIRCSSVGQKVGDLSGGNQQKVVIAKWLNCDSDIMIFDEPTRGIDVGAKFEIYKLLDELAARGKAIAVVSSDLQELMSICTRIAVMSAGRVATIFARGEWTEERIMTAALSGYLSDGN